jgi:hypothetical protein
MMHKFIPDWIILRVSESVLRQEGLDVNRIVKLGDVIWVPHPWRRNTTVNKDSWWDQFDKRIVLRLRIAICHPGK